MDSSKDSEDVIVEWNDGSQNCVHVKELRAVKRGDQINRTGTKVKMYYKKRWYFGTVILTERDGSQPMSTHSINDGDVECERSTNDANFECAHSMIDGDVECENIVNNANVECAHITNDGDVDCANSTNKGDVECALDDKLLDRDEDHIAETLCEKAKNCPPIATNINHVDENLDANCALYDKPLIQQTKNHFFFLSNEDQFLNVAREVTNESPLLDLNIIIENNSEQAQIYEPDENEYEDPYRDIDVEDPDDPDYQLPKRKDGNCSPDSDETCCIEDLGTEQTVENQTFQPESIPQLILNESRINVQPQQCCEVIGCNEEIFAACVRCNILNCYNHFLNDVSCENHQNRTLRVQSLMNRHNKENELGEAQTGTEYTKKGTIRKRKRFDTSIEDRKKLKNDKKKLKHSIKTSCEVTCLKKCNSHIGEEQRKIINQTYWSMKWKEQKIFLKSNTSIMNPVRTVSNPKKKNRSKSVKYFLNNETGEKILVCRTFFLTTLGFDKNNEKVVRNAINDKNFSPFDGRGHNEKKFKVDPQVIKTHIESFKPTISHYRREHAPNKRYLSSELTIKFMYDDFIETNPDTDISYDLYRKTIKGLNISFAKLGHEECEMCEQYDIHNPNKNDFRHRNCEMCLSYEKHHERYIAAREKYKADRNLSKIDAADDVGYFSADLQKVIMLPRIDMFKAVLFCPRLVVFNESFVPLGYKQSDRMTYAAIWHEAISGRKKEDIISAFKAFLTHYRDLKEIILWLDNCSAQNKNWALISFLIYFINSDETSSNKIIFRYFEPGHTFMSADEFHHQVEQALKQKKKVYDFEDFGDAVATTNKRKTIVKKMDVSDFYHFPDNTAITKLQQSNPRPYLRDIVEICFERGSKFMFYKCSFVSPDYIQLDCLKKSVLKKGFVKPVGKTNARGITRTRKNTIINILGPLMPANRKIFWETLKVNDTAIDLSEVIQD